MTSLNALLTGIGIGLGIPLGIGVLFVLGCFTQDLGIWRRIPKDYAPEPTPPPIPDNIGRGHRWSDRT